jgi:hypothetical protein
MSLHSEITSILENDELDEDSSELSKAEAIEELIEKYSWDEVWTVLLGILEDDTQSSHWRTVAEVIWGAVLDRRTLPMNKVIALLYYRFDPNTSSEDDDNLIWSIASELKQVGYLSEYEPLEDPEVISEFSKLKDTRIT